MSDNCQLVVFSNKAYNAIIRESFDKDPVETGGILLGHILDNGVWIVMEVLPPGINSVFQYAYFEYDEVFVNYLAQSVANQYKFPLDLLGLWHRHPGSMDVFSTTDDGTNATFAKQNPAGVISGLVNIDPKFRLTMYHMDMPTLQVIGRPNYSVVEVEVGDDIIPEEYFELRYFDGGESDLHPLVSSKGVERQVNRNLRNGQRNTVGNAQDQQSDSGTEGLDIQEIINQNLPPYNVPQNVTPKFINDFFSLWRASNKKWMYVLIAVIVLTVFAISIKSCSNVIEGISSYVRGKSVEDNSDDSNKTTLSLSTESIEFVSNGESKTITIINGNGIIHWISSNPDIATVNNGIVTALSNGESIIEAFVEDKSIGKCKVKVNIANEDTTTSDADDPTDQSISDDYALIDTTKTFQHKKAGIIKIGETFSVPIIKTGNPEVTYSCSTPEIATVDNNGAVTAKQNGITEIFILSNGKETDKFTLTVKNN